MDTGIRNPLSPQYDIATMISGIIGVLILVATITSFFFLITSGISWLTSGGDKAALETARNKIVAAIVGLLIVASVWAILTLLLPALGINFPNLSLPSIDRGLNF